MTKIPYNKGDAYEDKMFKIVRDLGLTPPSAKRAGAGGGADMVFVHSGKKYNLEIKEGFTADYGQRMLKWSAEKKWYWSVNDELTDAYTKRGVLQYLNRKGFVPRKHFKDDDELTKEDKEFDRCNFEDRISATPDLFFKFYALENCYYVQVGKKYGFYCLEKDYANLGVPQFDATFYLRFRAKTIHSKPLHCYGFYAVLKIKSKPTKSPFNLEKFSDQLMPPIEP